MDHALRLAARGLGRTWPNPAVGCVIERGGRILGRGRTADGGRPHAEVLALAQAGAAARGATAHVTLEPCAHRGATPSCADALIAAGIASAVVALRDPDPRTNGAGIARLRAAGIDVVEGVGEARARALQAGFLSRVICGRPLLTLKLACTLDGRIATASGESRWITGPIARAHVHAQRAAHDAVLIGAGTMRADDPRLDVRDLGPMPQPLRLVVSRRLAVPMDGRLTDGTGAPVWILHGPSAPEPARAALLARGVELIEVPGPAAAPVDPAATLRALGDRGLTRLYCEGGGTLAASLLTAGLVDRLDCYTAGATIGAEGRPSLGSMGIAALSEAPRLDLIETRRLGADVLHRWQTRD
jgi:diaminohydroxyphosphoribosylaminopyrimidine deaminase/5-amino-6-(5-phosphoribosylamino)uracil reductase